MKYSNYTEEDFAKDEYFQKWILDPDPMVRNFWENWLVNHPEKRGIIEKASKIIRLVDFKSEELPEEDFTEMWQNIIGKRSQSKTGPMPLKPQPVAKRMFLRNMAATFIGLLIVSGVWFFVTGQHLRVTYSNGFGETQAILLPDNSTVQLNANSTLRYVDNWDEVETREVWLEGEAFFSVRGQPTENLSSSPEMVKFIVHTENLNVEVLGTKFNVKRRRGKTQVVLNSGKVSLNDNQSNQRLDMKPGELVEFIEAEHKYVKAVIDPEPHTAWRNNQLIFDDKPLSDIAALLEDNYGIEVKILDEGLADRKFTGTSPVDDIDILLTKLSKIFYLKISKDGKMVMIEKY